jgi:MFS family permease
VTRTAWSHGQRVLTAGLLLMVTAIGFEGLAVPTILPAALDEFGGLPLYGWAFSGFWLTNLVGITVAGSQADRRGPLPPFAAGVLLFSAGLLIAGFAPDMAWIVAGRVVQGFGAGAIASITYVIIARGYDRTAQPRMIAIISSAWVIPGLVGPALAGYVAEAFSWRWTFLALVPLLPLALLALAGPMRRLGAPEREASAGDEDATARRRAAFHAVRLAAGAALLLAGLGAGNVLVLMLALAGGLLLAIPPLRRLLPAGTLSAQPGRGAAVAVVGLVSIAFFGVEAFIPLAVSSIRNAGTVAGGLALAAASVTWAAGSWVQARLTGRVSRRLMTGTGIGLIAIGIGVEAAIPITALPVWLAAVGWGVSGLGMGIAYSLATLATIETAQAGEEGAASAAVQLAEALGIGLGTGLAGAVVAYGETELGGMAPAITIANVLMLIACGIALSAAGRMPEPATAGEGEVRPAGSAAYPPF